MGMFANTWAAFLFNMCSVSLDKLFNFLTSEFFHYERKVS